MMFVVKMKRRQVGEVGGEMRMELFREDDGMSEVDV